MIICTFCPNPADSVCAWPTVKRFKISAKTMQPGDVIFDAEGHKAEVVSVAVATFTIQPRFGNAAHQRKNLSFSLLSSHVFMDLPAPCGAPACELHAREASEDRHYCADHWRAWEQVA